MKHTQSIVGWNVLIFGTQNIFTHWQPSCFKKYINLLRRGAVSSVFIVSSHIMPACAQWWALRASLQIDCGKDKPRFCVYNAMCQGQIFHSQVRLLNNSAKLFNPYIGSYAQGWEYKNEWLLHQWAHDLRMMSEGCMLGFLLFLLDREQK